MGPHLLQQPVLQDPAAVLKLQIRHAVSGSVCKMRSIYVKHAILEGSHHNTNNQKTKYKDTNLILCWLSCCLSISCLSFLLHYLFLGGGSVILCMIWEGSGSKQRPTKYMNEKSFKKCITSNFHLTSEQGTFHEKIDLTLNLLLQTTTLTLTLTLKPKPNKVAILVGLFREDTDRFNWQQFLLWCGAVDAEDSSQDRKILAKIKKGI